jgi:hypothetical protein
VAAVGLSFTSFDFLVGLLAAGREALDRERSDGHQRADQQAHGQQPLP